MSGLTRHDAILSETLREVDPARLDPDRAFGPLLAIIQQAKTRACRASRASPRRTYDG